ncbi:hypothetical protein QQM79_19640 [Marinobacteraceae bacterium S3BR75-40.1]
MSLYRREHYTREQQRETKFAPRVWCKGPHIQNFEVVMRTIFHPDHTDENKNLRVEAISREDLTKRGFSVFRELHTIKQRMEELEQEMIERKPYREAVGTTKLLCKNIRNIKDSDNLRAFVVLDSADEERDRGHALILCAEKQSKSKVKELKKKLASIMSRLYQLQEIYG